MWVEIRSIIIIQRGKMEGFDQKSIRRWLFPPAHVVSHHLQLVLLVLTSLKKENRMFH